VAVEGKKLISLFETIAPPHLAMEKDKIGLQIGSSEREAERILVALEITDEVIEEAMAKKANWIFTHHAPIFHPLSDIRTDQPRGKMIEKLLQHHIQVYAAHTNLDTAVNGVNDVLAGELGLQQAETFLIHGQEQYFKLVVFVPSTHLDVVRAAITENGAGAIGAYSHCTFAAKGTGTFVPGEDTKPFIGQQGQLEKVEEYRLETILPSYLQTKIVDALLAAHPYEEVAYDLYPLAQKRAFGMGKIGQLPAQKQLKDFVAQVKQTYELKYVQVVGDLNTDIQRVAVLGGAGSRYVTEAKRQNADVYITGDIDYHTAQLALEEGICLIDIGHATEQRVIPSVCNQLAAYLPADVVVYPSKVNFNPFQVC
jgi:dinuclear metal center YbgI/SA1388 family protein